MSPVCVLITRTDLMTPSNALITEAPIPEHPVYPHLSFMDCADVLCFHPRLPSIRRSEVPASIPTIFFFFLTQKNEKKLSSYLCATDKHDNANHDCHGRAGSQTVHWGGST